MTRTSFIERFRPFKAPGKYSNSLFTWKVLPLTSPKRPIGQNMKASTIALKQPSFNKQAESKKLLLFQNGVTQ